MYIARTNIYFISCSRKWNWVTSSEISGKDKDKDDVKKKSRWEYTTNLYHHQWNVPHRSQDVFEYTTSRAVLSSKAARMAWPIILLLFDGYEAPFVDLLFMRRHL